MDRIWPCQTAFSLILPNAELYLDPHILDNKPEMAKVVARIFAISASIERELRYLLLAFLGAKAALAIGIYDVLTMQNLQLDGSINELFSAGRRSAETG